MSSVAAGADRHPLAHPSTRPVGAADRSPRLLFLFPGQSSVDPGVLARASAAHPAAAAILADAMAVLGPEAEPWLSAEAVTLDCNRDVQVAVFLASQMYLAALRAEGVEAGASLGLSLGEYSHLVHIGAIRFEDALRLVESRGRAFDRAPEGRMVTVLAADHDAVADVVSRAAAFGAVVISNYNAPTQHVISGEAEAVAWAVRALEDDHGALTKEIERRVPMHSPLMADVAREFGAALQRAPWRTPAAEYRPNVTARSIRRARPDDFVAHLTRHVHEPVRWQASMEAALADHPGATVVEVGPGGVLTNLVSRAWRGTRCLRADAPDGHDGAAHLAALAGALRA